jgi:hypothetical protein
VEVSSPIVLEFARQQTLDDVDRFRQALMTLPPAGPACADDMFVQALSRPEPEGKAVVAEQSHRGRALGDDRRMVAHDRTGHRRHQADALGGVGQRSQDRPGERRMALLLEPGKVVIGNGREVEAGLSAR